MQISVLSLLATHTLKFKEYLYTDNTKLLGYLVKMLSVKNAGLRNSVYKALSALVMEVVIMIWCIMRSVGCCDHIVML